MHNDPIDILVAEDDPEDQLLVMDAFSEACGNTRVLVVNDGEELLRYLRREGDYAGADLPALILMDLNMPRMSGQETVREIRRDPRLRHIPIVILSTSGAEEDVRDSYELGVNTYVKKPTTFERLVEVVRTLGFYWFEIAELPPRTHGGAHG